MTAKCISGNTAVLQKSKFDFGYGCGSLLLLNRLTGLKYGLLMI